MRVDTEIGLVRIFAYALLECVVPAVLHYYSRFNYFLPRFQFLTEESTEWLVTQYHKSNFNGPVGLAIVHEKFGYATHEEKCRVVYYSIERYVITQRAEDNVYIIVRMLEFLHAKASLLDEEHVAAGVTQFFDFLKGQMHEPEPDTVSIALLTVSIMCIGCVVNELSLCFKLLDRAKRLFLPRAAQCQAALHRHCGGLCCL